MIEDHVERFLLPSGETVCTGYIPPTADDNNRVMANVPAYPESMLLDDKDIKKSLQNDKYKEFRKRRSKFILNQNGLGKCFPAGTLIRMADGSQRPIEKVVTLDSVLSAEGRIKTVLATMVRPNSEDLVRVCVWGHRHLRCTQEHPILTKTGYKEAQDLTDEDWVAIPKFLPGTVDRINVWDVIAPEYNQYSKSASLHSESRVTRQIKGKKASVQHTVRVPEYIDLDNDFGWVFGLFLAEGTSSSARVEWSLHKKEVDTHAAKLARICKEKFGVDLTIVVRNNQCQVKLYGKNWAELFTKLGSRKSHCKEFNQLISAGNVDFLKGVLQGWTEGDGIGSKSINLDGGVTVSHAMAMNMYDIANYLGKNPTVETLQPNVNPAHNIVARKMRWIVKWRIDQIGEQSPRFEETDSLVWRRVHKIDRESHSGWVYNIEVADDHSYVAEGIGVHNCNASATVGGIHNVRDMAGHKHVVLSDCYLYMNINGGRDNGSMLADGFRFAEGGIAPRSFTYNGKTYNIPHNVYQKRQVSAELLKAADVVAKEYTTWEAYRLPVGDYATFKRYLASALALDYQVVFAWHVNNASMRLRNGYVAVGNGPGNHATLWHSAKYVGGSDVIHPDMQNSWGGGNPDPAYGPPNTAGWGEGGFGLFTMQDAYRCAHNHVFWVITGSKVTKESL